MRHVKHPFPPIISPASQVLILGSVPSVKSVENSFYYMHPQNRFWHILSYLLNDDFVKANSLQKTKLLVQHKIALYDSVEECDIVGSNDSAITNVIAADISTLIAQSNINAILCNGNAAYTNLIKAYPQFTDIAHKLPSSSPANALYDLQRLCKEWQILVKLLR